MAGEVIFGGSLRSTICKVPSINALHFRAGSVIFRGVLTSSFPEQIAGNSELRPCSRKLVPTYQ